LTRAILIIGLGAERYMLLRMYKEAISDLNVAISIDPNYALFIRLRALAYNMNGDYNKAM